MESAYRCLKIAGQIAALDTLFLASGGSGQEVMRPVISEDISPLEAIAPVAADGHIGFGYLRKPPGEGPFPAVVFIHGGTLQRPPGGLRTHILGAGVSRFLEAGYVVSSITYRSREEPNTQTQPSLADTLAAVEFLRDQAYIDAESVVVNGCSGGGELALRMAGQTEFPLVIVEEPRLVKKLIKSSFQFYVGAGEHDSMQCLRCTVAALELPPAPTGTRIVASR